MGVHLTNDVPEPAIPGEPSAPAAAAGEPAPVRSYEELGAELAELEKQYPEPQRGDEFPDVRWYQQHERELRAKYLGMHVAILNGAVIGAGPDELQLRINLSRKLGIHPYRPFMAFFHYPGSYSMSIEPIE